MIVANSLINEEELNELKRLYYTRYYIQLTDEQALELGIRLVSLFKAIIRPIPVFDNQIPTSKNEAGN